jgi:hypothetical protein
MKPKEQMQARVLEVNRILDTMRGGIFLYLTPRGQLRMGWGSVSFPAVLRGEGTWPRYGYKERPTGGTGFQALAQLIRYCRDWTRLPVVTWEYWTGPKILLGSAETLRLIKESDYGDPEKTKCVHCGSTTFDRGLDWWSLGGIVGPCCRGGRCRTQKGGGEA